MPHGWARCRARSSCCVASPMMRAASAARNPISSWNTTAAMSRSTSAPEVDKLFEMSPTTAVPNVRALVDGLRRRHRAASSALGRASRDSAMTERIHRRKVVGLRNSAPHPRQLEMRVGVHEPGQHRDLAEVDFV